MNKLPVLKSGAGNKLCKCCEASFDVDQAKASALKLHGFYWWNCECGGTLCVEVEGE